MNTKRLERLVAQVCEVREELRRQEATPVVIEAATERLVRDAWEPLVPPASSWPWFHSLPRCARCDGTGLEILRDVRNRLGVVVDEGRPCHCPRGVRFMPKLETEADHTQAGKTSKPARSWSRAGR